MAETVGAASRILGHPHVGATTARVNVRRRHGRVCETAIETAIMIAEETTRGTDTGIADVDGKCGLCAQHMSDRSIVRYAVIVCVPQKIYYSFERIL